MIIPIKKVQEKVEIARQDSDTSLFLSLMYAGEHLLKLVTLAMVSGLHDSKGSNSNDQYSHKYNLVHADSLGNWSQTLEAVISGPSSHYLSESFQSIKNDLTDKNANPSWQFGAVIALNNCLKALNENNDEMTTKIQLKNWFPKFVQLRNEARAHGIPSAEQIKTICINLEKSIKLITENLNLFKAPWLFVKQHISGKYRIAELNENNSKDDILNIVSETRPNDGIYICLSNKLFSIDLISSTVEALDYYYPNGNFNDKTYETISYYSGKKYFVDSSPYLRPPGQLPTSETQGKGKLELINSTFTNIPYLQNIYINRHDLEEELESVLMVDDTYPIITLSGRGGIGKTSLALHVLHKLCCSTTNRFDAIVWFSARDIDLLEEGPKKVRPQVLKEEDIACEFSRLLEPPEYLSKSFNHKEYIENEFRKADRGTNGRILFVMDNFETLKNPVQIYKWIATHIRNPNKILITTRLRDFKADYPINIVGMNKDEFNELIEKVSSKLEIQHLLNQKFLEELYKESDGHPYVVKIMLGEVSKQKELKNVKRIIASKDEILTALFERTYTDLSLSARRVFLTLCSWRNIFPEIAIVSVLNREENELINVEDGIEELFRYSFVEIIKSNLDDSVFISVPLAAFEFGRNKLSVSQYRSVIQLDKELLNHFGVTQYTDINKGLRPKVEYFFKSIAPKSNCNKAAIAKYLPIIQFVCRKYPEGWLLLHNLYIEMGDSSKAIDSLQHYIADHRISGDRKIDALETLSKLYSLRNDFAAEAQTYVDICNIDGIRFVDLSNAVQSLMNLFKEKKTLFTKEVLYVMLVSIADKMNIRIHSEGSISDITKLAWVYLHLEKKEKAKALVLLALKRDNNYFHALNLAKILKMDVSKIISFS